MKSTGIAIWMTVFVALLTVAGDYFLKVASREASPYLTWPFLCGIGFYAVSAFGVVYVFRHVKMAAVGAIYCVSIVVSLMLIGMIFFDETLNLFELVGLGLAGVSLLLLSRFVES